MKTFFKVCSVEHWVQINRYLGSCRGAGSGEEGKEKLFKAKDRSHILFYTLFSQILARGRPQTTFNKSVENDCFLGQKSLGNGR